MVTASTLIGRLRANGETMKRSAHRINRQQEAGVALLLSIFVLLAISVVGIAMILASGTESALAGNYRASTSAY